MKRKAYTIVGLIILVACFSIATVKMFGSTVSKKFNSANSSVVSNVDFGGPSDYDYERKAEVAAPEEAMAEPMPQRAKLDPSSIEAVPPDGKPNRNEFKNTGVNPMTETKKDRFSTFAVDVDTGSYTIARRNLKNGAMPNPTGVRIEEFVNYFQYNYASPEEGPFLVDLEAVPSPFVDDPNTHILRVGVQGKRIKDKDRKPVHLTFLVDVSGSMTGADRLGLVKTSLKTAAKNLQDDDTVAIATYAGFVSEVLPPTGAAQRSKIYGAIDQLESGGGTGMSDGMTLAYKLAMKSFKKGHVNRVVVLSDGDANIGATSTEEMLASIKSHVEEGITMSTIGFGMGNYKDARMEQLANKGNGNYYYIDTAAEARKVFGAQLNGTLQVIAKDVKIQVEFHPEKISHYRLIGYENRAIADQDFRDDTVDAGEIGAGHTVTALYEVKTVGPPSGEMAVVRVRAKKPDGRKANEMSFAFLEADMKNKLTDANRDFIFQMAVVQFAEILRRSPYAEGLKLELVEEIAKGATRNEEDRLEFLELVKMAKRLNPS